MLVLSRKLGERILVPHCELAVTVVGIEGNTVKLVSPPRRRSAYTERNFGASHVRAVTSESFR